MRTRPSDELIFKAAKIGICRRCSRYGEIDREQKICTLPNPFPIFGISIPKEFFKRIEYCKRVTEKRESK